MKTPIIAVGRRAVSAVMPVISICASCCVIWESSIEMLNLARRSCRAERYIVQSAAEKSVFIWNTVPAMTNANGKIITSKSAATQIAAARDGLNVFVSWR